MSIANRHKGLLELVLLYASIPEGPKFPNSLFPQPSECKVSRKLYTVRAYVMLGMFLVYFSVVKGKRKNYFKGKKNLV